MLRYPPLLQARNSAAFWAATGKARGEQVIHRPGYVAVVGGARSGTRVLIQEPGLDVTEVDEITSLVRDAEGPVDLEDPFSATDLGHLGLRSWQMPVMSRAPGPAAPPGIDVVRALDPGSLAAAGTSRALATRHAGGLFHLSALVRALDHQALPAAVALQHDAPAPTFQNWSA